MNEEQSSQSAVTNNKAGQFHSVFALSALIGITVAIAMLGQAKFQQTLAYQDQTLVASVKNSAYRRTPAAVINQAPEQIHILSVTVSGIGTRSATVSWVTDIKSTGTITYGPNGLNGDEVSDTKLGATHSIKLDELKPGTLYNFEIIATGTNGTRDAANGSFKTKKTGRD